MKTPNQLRKLERKAEKENILSAEKEQRRRVTKSIENLVEAAIARGTLSSAGGMIEYDNNNASDVPIILDYLENHGWEVTYQQATETTNEWSMTTKSEYTFTRSWYVFDLKPKKAK